MTAVLANDFRAQWDDIGDDVLAAVRRVGESGWYVLGEEVAAFERDLAGFHGTSYAVGVASGLDAIEIGLRAAGIGPGAVVVTTPLTAFATALAVMRAGAALRFVDVDDEGLIDLDAVEDLAAQTSIDAVLPVHLYGHPVNHQRLITAADAVGAVVLEDVAQAIGGRSDGQPHGSNTLGAATSFYPTKNLGALGDGGALLTNDAALAARARQLRDYGQVAKYEHAIPGLNSRLDELHAGVLRTAMLPRLEQALRRRREIADRYLNTIDHQAIRVPALPVEDSSWHLFPVFVEGGARDALKAWLAEADVQTAVHYPILASAQQALPQPEDPLQYPVAHRLATSELSLPIHPYLSDDAIDQVVSAVNAWRP